MDNQHYVTPEEAFKMDCVATPHEHYGCSGPKCMAWRWGKLKEPEYRVENNIMGPHNYSTTHGYCGMVQS